MIDLQALVGDSVDNVPGVPGIGLKTAAKLLQDFGTLDNLMANVDKVSGTERQENLRGFAQEVQLSRKLVRLATEVPVSIDWDRWRLRDWNAPRLLALFQQWGFHRFADEVPAKAGTAEPEAAAREQSASPPAVQRQGELFADDAFPFGANVPGNGEPPPTPLTRDNYHLIDTPKKFDTFFRELHKCKRIAFDLETTDLDPLRSEIVGYSFCWKPGEAWYVAVRGPAGEDVLDPDWTPRAARTSL